MSFLTEALIFSAVLGVAISYSYLYLYHVMMSLHMLVSFVNNGFRIRATYRASWLSYFLLFTLVWYVLSLLWTIHYPYSFRYLFYLICGIYLAFTVFNYIDSTERLKRFLMIVAIPYVLEIVISLLEIATDFRMPVSPVSEYLELFGRDNKSRLNLVMSTPTGFRWNPNNLAVSMVLLFPFFLFVKNNWIKVLGCASILLIILMASSRGAFIAMLFAIALYPIFYKVRFIPIYIFVGMLGLSMVISNLDYLENHDNEQVREISQSFDMLEDYLFEESKEHETSIGIRQKLIQNGLLAINETMWIGVGGGASVAVQELTGGVGVDAVASMHNFWLEIAVDAGVIFGLAFIIWYLILTFRVYMTSMKTRDDTIYYTSKALTLSFLGFLLGAISSSSTIYFLPMWMAFGLALALIRLSKGDGDLRRVNKSEVLSGTGDE